MTYKIQTLPKSQVELTITVELKDYQKHLEKAAVQLSEKLNIKGFRKGKAPFDIVKKEAGEMAILEQAIDAIVQESFYGAVKEEKLETVGMPQIKMEKMAPGNPVEYKATVALLPKVELADISKIKVKHDLKPVEDKKVDEVIESLQKMHAKEVVKSGEAQKDDKVVVDMDIFLDKVPVEGGQSKDHQVYLSEKHYIPGFNEKLIGLKKGEEKEFALDFPKEHYQKHLAGKKVDFKVKVKDVYKRELPPADDELAKKLGQDSLEKLKALIKQNLEQEAKGKADQKFEIEILNSLIEKSKFDDIPDVLIDAERQKMFYELQRDLEKNGVTIEQYLQDIKKKEEELFEEFKTQAEKRAKAALISRQVAKEQSIEISDGEVDKELEMMKQMYKDNEEYMENLKKPEVRDTIAMTLQNRKVVEWLKEQVKSD